jgi:uracil-DNA glycosylase
VEPDCAQVAGCATAGRGETLTQTVQNWRHYRPALLPLPHPSPRNNIWLRKNAWFEAEILPMLQQKIRSLISDDQGA